MAAHADDISSPTHPLRWLIVTALGASVFAAAAALLRRRATPSVTPMSEEWIRSHGFDTGRRGDDY